MLAKQERMKIHRTIFTEEELYLFPAVTLFVKTIGKSTKIAIKLRFWRGWVEVYKVF